MKEKIKLLLVEDDANLRYIVQSGLEDLVGGYEVITAANGMEGLEAYDQFHPDVIVSDVDMPEMNGFEMVRRIRETDGDVIILLASGLHSPKDVKSGYNFGVNNYIKKPYMPDELDAHIGALMELKEQGKSRNKSALCHFGHYTLDAGHATLCNEKTGCKQIITPRENDLLLLLAQNPNEVVRRDVILSRIWKTEDDYFASRSLDVFINKLRKLFESDPAVEVKTIRGVGVILAIE